MNLSDPGIREIFRATYTVLIFLLGFYLNGLRERMKEKKKLKELADYFATLIAYLESPMLNQIKYLDNFISFLETNENHDFKLQMSPSLNVDNLRNLDENELFKSFVTSRKGKKEDRIGRFSKIMNAVNYIYEVKRQLIESFNDFNKKYQLFQNDWNQSVQKIANLYERFMFDLNNSGARLEDDPFLLEYNLYIQKWHIKRHYPDIENYREMFLVYTSLVVPLDKMCEKYSNDPRRNYLLPIILEARHALDEIIHLKKVKFEAMSEIKSGLTKTKETIFESIEELKKFKWRKVL